MTQDKINTLKEAQQEIRNLRRTNELLRARTDTMDLMAALLFATPQSQQRGVSVDVCYALQKEIDDLEDSMKPQPE